MTSDEQAPDRRQFLITGGAALAGAVLPESGTFSTQSGRLNLALTGTDRV